MLNSDLYYHPKLKTILSSWFLLLSLPGFLGASAPIISIKIQVRNGILMQTFSASKSHNKVSFSSGATNKAFWKFGTSTEISSSTSHRQISLMPSTHWLSGEKHSLMPGGVPSIQNDIEMKTPFFFLGGGCGENNYSTHLEHVYIY